MRMPRIPSRENACSSPPTPRSSPCGATRKRTHAPSAPPPPPGGREGEANPRPPPPGGGREPLSREPLAERRVDRERVELDADGDAAELGVVAAADARRELADERRAVLRDEHLRVRRPRFDSHGGRSPPRRVARQRG